MGDEFDRLAAEHIRVRHYDGRAGQWVDAPTQYTTPHVTAFGLTDNRYTTTRAERDAAIARDELAAMIRTAIAADRQRVSGAVRGLVDKLPLQRCAIRKCGRLALMVDECMVPFCDECAAKSDDPSVEDAVPYAHALRTLLAMLDGDGGRAEKVDDYRRGLDAAKAIVAEFATNYHADIFTAPDPAKHPPPGYNLPDQYSGAMARHVCEVLVRKIRELDGETRPPPAKMRGVVEAARAWRHVVGPASPIDSAFAGAADALDGEGGRAEKVERVVEAARTVHAVEGSSSREAMRRMGSQHIAELCDAVDALDGEGGEGR